MMKFMQFTVRTLTFYLSGMGNHWKVPSKEVKSILGFNILKECFTSCAENRPQTRTRVEARREGRFLCNLDAREDSFDGSTGIENGSNYESRVQ